MTVSVLLLVILLIVLIGVLPAWPYSSAWGYGPSGLAAVVLAVILILALLGYI